MSPRLLVSLALLAVLLGARPAAAAPADLWARLAGGGHVVVMRHATAPGVGDPADFQLSDCATQRNLSEAGRAEARRVGEAFRAHGVPVTRVLSSRWCRCLETARLAFGQSEPWPPLDSLFGDRRREPAQTAAVRRLVGEWAAAGNLVLVTHQSNISALTGVYPASGEMVVLAPEGAGGFTVAGRLAPVDLTIR